MNGNRPRTEIRILHTSDNHVADMPTCANLGIVVDKANELKVDLVLLAGDFFDNPRIDEEVVWEAMAHLGRLEMPAVLLPGNHDQLDANSVYHHDSFKQPPPNLHIIRDPDGETVLFEEKQVSVWGRPTYDHRMTFRPLQGPPPRNGPWWHIGIAHGWYVPPGEVAVRSSPIFAYEIEATGYDYVALGHSDVFTDLSQGTVRAAYSGAPAGSIFGNALGYVALVHLLPGVGVQIERVPLAR